MSACQQTFISILYSAYRHTGSLQCLYFTMTLIVYIRLIDYYVLKYVGACVLMCTNVTRGSQYIVMHNTGAMDLEISEQIDIMKVDDVLNISREYSYIHKHFR